MFQTNLYIFTNNLLELNKIRNLVEKFEEDLRKLDFQVNIIDENFQR